jgi:hypothetical protein
MFVSTSHFAKRVFLFAKLPQTFNPLHASILLGNLLLLLRLPYRGMVKVTSVTNPKYLVLVG